MNVSEAHSHLRETKIESEVVFQGRVLTVLKDRVRLPDGGESIREYIRHPGAVIIIPVLDGGELIFERQFRYPLRRVFLELPAGKIEPGEEILATAKRELIEETGYSANEWRRVGRVNSCIGYSDERVEIFLARGLCRESAQQLDPGEFIDLEVLSLTAALQAFRQGEITDGKTIAALFWAEKTLRDGW
ncbi:MAG: NUDIX hydrolase [Candidatus Accumulibacter sp.]|jgi:ADP-ribose pyrophosphatase|nr:NUDIX hydrolase [Accumulibacter sp.]